MDKLIELLNNYWNSHEANDEDGGLKFFNVSADGKDMMDEIWNKCFIGSCWNPEACQALHENGYSTRTFERDGFGILIAGIGKDGKWISIG